MRDWIEAALGLAGGFAAAYWIAAATLPRLVERSRNPTLVIKLSAGGSVIALLPALLLSLVVGATLAGALGVALVFALVLLAGLFAGVLLARWLRR